MPLTMSAKRGDHVCSGSRAARAHRDERHGVRLPEFRVRDGSKAMTAAPHSAATQHMPIFIIAPGETDMLMIATAIFLAFGVFMFGLVFFRLHTLPERIAHRGHKLQFEVVAVLGLISLLTHMHIFWIAGLLLALIDIPDFSGYFGRIAGSVEKMAGVPPGEGDTLAADETAAGAANEHAHDTAAETKRAGDVAVPRRRDQRVLEPVQ